jgi:PAS domain S-box-containing protein
VSDSKAGQRQPPAKPIGLAAFVLQLIGLCALPLLVLSLWLGVSSVRAEQERLRANADAVARRVIGSIDDQLRDQLAALNSLAQSPSLDEGDPWTAFRDQAALFRSAFGAHVVLVDAALAPLMSTQVPPGQAVPPLAVAKGRRAAQLALASGLPAVGDVVQRTDGASVVDLAVPTSGDGGARLVLVTTSTAEYLASHAALEIPAHWGARLADSSNATIREWRGASASHRAEVGGYEAALRSSVAPWTIEVAVPARDYAAQVATAAVGIAVAVLIAALLTGYAALRGSRRIAVAIAWLAGEPSAATPATMFREVATVKHMLDEAQTAHRLEAERRNRVQEQLEKLAQAVEQSSSSVIITDLDGKIEYVNEAFVRVSGYAREEALGRNPGMLRGYRASPTLDQTLWRALKDGRMWKGELRNRRKDGREYIDLAVVTPLRRADGTITHYVAVQEDITERKQMAAELDRHRRHLESLVAERTRELAEARERAEAASVAKSAFLANMSHEIRTPMNAIVGLTHLLREEATTSRQSDRLGKVETAARHLLSIINDILDLSKIEAHRLRLEEDDFRLADVLDAVASLIMEGAGSKGVAVRIDAVADPVWLRGDATRLRQALLNYASNAVKFTPSGQVTIRARLAEERAEDVLVRFEVDDTGIGIDKALVERLFEPFEQADVSTTRRFGGTGLGLAITQRLAQLMGGQVGAESLEPQGSRFWFTARLHRGRPRTPSPPEGGAPVEKSLRHHAGARVLLAEDNAVNRELTAELLRMVGLQVDVAENGRVAIEQVRQNDYALVLMDVQMPDVGGREATRTIRAIPGRDTLPIIAITANAFEEDRAACLAAGMNDFLAKPVEVKSLYSKLLAWLPGQVQPEPQDDPLASPMGRDTSAPEFALLERLASHPGFDLAGALARFGGDGQKYAETAEVFASVHGEDGARLRSAAARGDLAEVHRIVHELMGSGGNLGMTALCDVLRAFQELTRAQPPQVTEGVASSAIQSGTDRIDSALAEVLSTLR